MGQAVEKERESERARGKKKKINDVVNSQLPKAFAVREA